MVGEFGGFGGFGQKDKGGLVWLGMGWLAVE